VIAVDADPDADLAMTVGFAEPIIPLATEWDLIANRVGTGGLIKLNPTVDDIPDRYSVDLDGIRLLVLGGVRYRIVGAQSFVLVAVTAHGLNLPGSSQCVILLFGI